VSDCYELWSYKLVKRNKFNDPFFSFMRWTSSNWYGRIDCLYFVIVLAVGCSDLVPPSDAWLKRSVNVATVGCYMTRQTWILTCDQTGRWTGTFGNCTQRTFTCVYSHIFHVHIPVYMYPSMELKFTHYTVNFYFIIISDGLRIRPIRLCWLFVELLAIQRSSDVIIRPAESKQQTSIDVKGNSDADYTSSVNDSILRRERQKT